MGFGTNLPHQSHHLIEELVCLTLLSYLEEDVAPTDGLKAVVDGPRAPRFPWLRFSCVKRVVFVELQPRLPLACRRRIDFSCRSKGSFAEQFP